MRAARAVFFAVIGIVAAGAQQQQPAAGTGSAGGPPAFGGRIGTVGPSQTPIRPRPLFSVFGVPVAIWTPVPAPYNVAANRNLASRPID